MNNDQVIHKFRSAFNGFNRRDVMAYIAQMDAAHSKETEALKKELAELRGRQSKQRAELEKLQGEKGSATAEEARVRSSLEESSRTLARTRGELTQAESKLAVAKNELTRLQAQVKELEPMAKNYEELKERVAVIDLEAHKRAQSIVDEAQTQAEGIRQEAVQWVRGLMEQYDSLCQSVSEMEKQAKEVEQLSASFREGDEAARRLRELGVQNSEQTARSEG